DIYCTRELAQPPRFNTAPLGTNLDAPKALNTTFTATPTKLEDHHETRLRLHFDPPRPHANRGHSGPSLRPPFQHRRWRQHPERRLRQPYRRRLQRTPRTRHHSARLTAWLSCRGHLQRILREQRRKRQIARRRRYSQRDLRVQRCRARNDRKLVVRHRRTRLLHHARAVPHQRQRNEFRLERRCRLPVSADRLLSLHRGAVSHRLEH